MDKMIAWTTYSWWQNKTNRVYMGYTPSTTFIIPAWWRHQMETFSALLALCAGNSPVPVNSPHKGQWRGALMFSFICAWIHDWVNNREAGDLGRHRGHYDVIVMRLTFLFSDTEQRRRVSWSPGVQQCVRPQVHTRGTSGTRNSHG